MPKRVVVNGACGRMGKEVVKTVVNDTEDNLVGVFDKINVGENINSIIDIDKKNECIIKDDLNEVINNSDPDVIIDFTTPEIIMENIKTGLTNGIHMIVGTTGITDTDLEEINKLTNNNDVNALIVPNFALGAVLLMKFCTEAAQYMEDAEIIELHHDQKIDAPSGTAIKTAELINQNRAGNETQNQIEKIAGARGENKNGIHIHSVRLPGLVAHQEVIFGGEGQALTIRHDSYNRKSFMPGVKMALDKITEIDGLVYGLENIM